MKYNPASAYSSMAPKLARPPDHHQYCCVLDHVPCACMFCEVSEQATVELILLPLAGHGDGTGRIIICKLMVDALDRSGALERAHALNFADTQVPMNLCACPSELFDPRKMAKLKGVAVTN